MIICLDDRLSPGKVEFVLILKFYLVQGVPKKTEIRVQWSFQGVKWPQIKKLNEIDTP